MAMFSLMTALLAAEKAQEGGGVGGSLSSFFSFLTSPLGWAAR